MARKGQWRSMWPKSSKKRRFTDAQRAAYWKKKYNECRRAYVAYVKRSK